MAAGLRRRTPRLHQALLSAADHHTSESISQLHLAIEHREDRAPARADLEVELRAAQGAGRDRSLQLDFARLIAAKEKDLASF
jgi:hypothetical protein